MRIKIEDLEPRPVEAKPLAALVTITGAGGHVREKRVEYNPAFEDMPLEQFLGLMPGESFRARLEK